MFTPRNENRFPASWCQIKHTFLCQRASTSNLVCGRMLTWTHMGSYQKKKKPKTQCCYIQIVAHNSCVKTCYVNFIPNWTISSIARIICELAILSLHIYIYTKRNLKLKAMLGLCRIYIRDTMILPPLKRLTLPKGKNVTSSLQRPSAYLSLITSKHGLLFPKKIPMH